MSLFRFPNACARCETPDPAEKWNLRRVETYGRMRTTYTIAVPVCHVCGAELRSRRRIAWLSGLGIGVAVVLAVRFGLFLNEAAGGWIVGGILGVIAWVISGAIIERAAGVHFASIGGGGRSLRFKNAGYQSEFDRINRYNISY
jgi:hypothetical protein